MADKSFLGWPLFLQRHRALAETIERWSSSHPPVQHGNVDAACHDLVAWLGRDGWHARAATHPDGAQELDVRDGVRHGHIAEGLYRKIRALRIYEGASDVQKVVIARETPAG